jgi:hypothetical protein
LNTVPPEPLPGAGDPLVGRAFSPPSDGGKMAVLPGRSFGSAFRALGRLEMQVGLFDAK